MVVRSATDPDLTIFLLDLDRPVDQPYMILESDIECPSKAVHIINFGYKKVYTVGRRINNDISISDISVSRNHSTFKIEGNSVYLMDLDSKFGTFLKFNEPFKIAKDGQIMPI